MNVIERGVLRGPHLYSGRPMVRIQLDLEALEDWPTDRLPDFQTRLLEALPGLHHHGCSYREPGGLVRRMAEGTWLGHVIEHVALELQSQAGARVTRGKTRSVKASRGVYNILYAYEEPETALLAGRLAIELVDRLLPDPLRGVNGLDKLSPVSGTGLEVGGMIAALRDLRRQYGFGPSTAALVRAARRRGIPVERLNGQSLIQLGWGRRRRLLRASVTDGTGLIAAELAGDKAQTKSLLQSVGLPVASGILARRSDDAVALAAKLRRPLVVKPLDGNHGRGVTTGVRDDDALRQAFDEAVKISRSVIVEEELPGDDHRILVIGGSVVAVAQRIAARVTGDGVSTIAQLVARVNEDPRRGSGHEASLTRIRLDDAAALDMLRRAGLGVDDVPESGRIVTLRGAANLSSGGTAIDRTDDIHPENASIARRAALMLGLDVAGVDLLAPDIRRSVRETGGGIVEVNAAPGLRMHLEPSEGESRDVAAPIVDLMYPRGARARIPVLAVTGTNGKSTVGRMVAHVFRSLGKTVGLTNTSGVYIGGEQVSATDASGPKSARMVLRDPTVEVAVLECARGGILREGLAFDRCDVGAVLNIQPDHLGLKGVAGLSDLADVKAVVVESVGRRGLSVLNADDRYTVRMARHAGGRVCWFTMKGGEDIPALVRDHIADGGAAAVCEPGGALQLYDRGTVVEVCRTADIPATFAGQATFNVQNALAAIAMCHGAGVAPPDIASALATFSSSYALNPGRLNVEDKHGFRAILDYAHNPEALRALGRMVKAITPPDARSIAMVSIPGDRRDQEIREMGAISAMYFDQLVFRETPDNRGREKGGVMRLMREGALEQGCPSDRIHEVYEELDAARASLQMARSGDVVILMPTRVQAVWDIIQNFQPAAGSTLGATAVDPNLEPPHG